VKFCIVEYAAATSPTPYRAVWSFTGGALFQRAPENYLPLTTLVDLVRDEAAKVRRTA
jgi:hypothetical protein